MERWIMHVDMDAFFASVEQLDHPEYRGQPVIVGGLGNRGVVSTASYEARHFGVHSALSMMEARRRCPQGIFVAGRYDRYHEISRQIFAVFAEFSPKVEPLSVDEAFLDITGMERLFSDRRSYAEQLRQRIFEKTGLVASVGIAPNKFLAKLASDLEKPAGLVLIERGQEEAVLFNLPIRRLWGVGGKTNEKLGQLGFKTIGDIAAADRRQLEKFFGGRLACHLIELAHGRDDREVETERVMQSIGNEVTFAQDLTQTAQAECELLALAEKVGWRLRQAGVKTRTVTLKIRTASFRTITRSRTLPEPTNFDKELYQMALELYRQAAIGEGIRLLGITGSNLLLHEQESLFGIDDKQKKLYQAVDSLKGRFGNTIITKAQLVGRSKKE